MFSVSISTAIMIFITLPLGIVLLLWYVFEKSVQKEVPEELIREEDWVVECPHCAHVFVSAEQQEIIVCPQCELYFKREDLVDEF